MKSRNTFTIKINGQKREIELPGNLKSDPPLGFPLNKKMAVMSSILVLIVIAVVIVITITKPGGNNTVSKGKAAFPRNKPVPPLEMQKDVPDRNVIAEEEKETDDTMKNRESGPGENELLNDYDNMLKMK